MVGRIGFNGSRRGTPTNNPLSTTKKLLAVGGVALGLGGLVLFGSEATAAGELAAAPPPPAIIDDYGLQSHESSSYPADPVWPTSPAWPGKHSNSCCSR